MGDSTKSLGYDGKLSGKCVLCIVDANNQKNINRACLVAQSEAINKSLPIAVVCNLNIEGSINDKNHLISIAKLESLEAKLKRVNIPLIILVGNPLEQLSGMIHHTQPESIYLDPNLSYDNTKQLQNITKHVKYTERELSDLGLVSQRLVKHPFDWPGVVIPIKELRSIF